jgi:uncharacterized phage protein (TIGR02218 family)
MPSQISTELAEHWNGSEVTPIVIATILYRDGSSQRFCGWSADVTFENMTYKATSDLSLSALSTSLGAGVDNAQVSGSVDSTGISLPLIDSGSLNFASYEISLIDLEKLSAGKRILLTGTVGDIEESYPDFVAKLRSLTSGMKNSSSDLSSKTCTCFRLGDLRCKVNFMTGTVPGRGNRAIRSIRNVTAAISTRVLRVSGESAPNDFFTFGHLKFLSGANEGLEFDIKAHESEAGSVAKITLRQEVPFVIASGDEVQLLAGCNKKLRYESNDEARIGSTCQQFGNQINFRGQPFIPGEDQTKQVAQVQQQSSGGGKK